jgi:signal transduction histidine kinase/CheY-like chemotaxis protein
VSARRRIPLGAVLSIVAIISTLPLGIFAGVLIYRTWRAQQEQVDRQNIEVVRAISVAIDQEVEHAVAALSVLATLVPADPRGLRDFDDLCRRTVKMQDWEAVRLATPSGEVVFSSDVPFGAPVKLATADWVERVVATRRPAASTARRDPQIGQWVVIVGVPVTDGDGRVRYALGARLLASSLSRILQRQGAPADGIATLLDQTPQIIARTKNEELYTGRTPTKDFMERSGSSDEGALRSQTLEGMASYSAWHRSELTGWTVGVALPRDAVDRPTWRSLAALIAAAAALTAVSIGTAMVIRKRLVESQLATAESARALARGEPMTARESWIAEIHDVTVALHDAAAILDTRLRELDDVQQEAERRGRALLEREQAGRRAAETLSRAKDEFVATVSHELRTPLNAIFGWVTLLRSAEMDPARLKQGLEVIHRNAAAQLALINDLLDMSRVLRGTVRLDMQPLDLAVVVDAAIDALHPVAEARRIALNVDAERGNALVSGDQSRLQQIIFNIVSNSLKFTPPGGRIDVTLRQSGEDAVLTINDTGEGIAPEFLPHVFERFRQETSDETRQHEGLGIGLSLVRHLTELHGGKVKADSAGKARGATFTLTLPLLGARAAAAPEANEPGDVDARARSLDGTRVLVVDDDADARELISMVVRGAGGKVVEAASVADAKSAIADGVPDAIVSDIAMPGGNGYEFARELRASPRTASLPLVAVTAYTRAEDRDRAIAAGFDAHLSKPFEPRALIGLLVGLIADNAA